MTAKRSASTAALILTVAVFASVATAQWPEDPQENLVIADRVSRQTVPKVASTPDCGCYVGWFDLASGNYDVYLQRLDAAGVEQWPHNGILISAHPQDTWLVEWDLIADSNGNAVLAFSDLRDGANLSVHAYCVSPDGQMLWGVDGVSLSTGGFMNVAPCVVQTSTGDFVFVWQSTALTGTGDIRMQRLSPGGVEQLDVGGVPIVQGTGQQAPCFQAVAPANDGSVIVSWLTYLDYLDDKFLHAERFSAAGVSMWGGPVDVYDEVSLPAGYRPLIQADGNGGAFIIWHRTPLSLYNSLVQHLDADGNELFAHNGVEVSTTPGRDHINPTFAYDPDVGNILIFWTEQWTDPATLWRYWGVYGQKLSAAGARLWGDGGAELLPLSTIELRSLRSVPYADGAMLFFIDAPTGDSNVNRVVGMRVDGSGNHVWPGSSVVVSSLLSTKSRLPVTIDRGGVAKLVWEDDRDGNWDTVDVYGQNVDPDGTLGVLGLADFELLAGCLTGPGATPPPDCSAADRDGDADVDLADFALFQSAFDNLTCGQ